MEVEPIKYALGNINFDRALVYDKAVKTPRPALLMAPNWLGATPAAIDRRVSSPPIVMWCSSSTCTGTGGGL
jgi:hypothetical protein